MKRLLVVNALLLCAGNAAAQSTPPPGPSIMVPTVSVPRSVTGALNVEPAQLTTLLAQSLMSIRVGNVRTQEDIKAVVEQNAQQQLLGCAEMNCVLDLGRMAGADLLVRGEAGMLGNRLLFSATLINVPETRVVSIVTRAVPLDALANGGLNALALELFPSATPPAGTPAPTASTTTPTTTTTPATPAATPPASRERVVVTGRAWTDVDPSVRATALGKAADVVNEAGGFQAVSSEELKAVLQNEADAQALGAAETGTVQKVAEAVKAAFLVQVELGRAGRAFVLGASLVDVKTVDVVNRSSLVFQDEKQLLDAVNVATRRLFGMSATLPPADADPSRLETRLQAMVNDALGKYREMPQGGAAGLAILPFAEAGAEARNRKLGAQLASFVGNLTGGAQGVTLVGKDKVKELSKQHDLQNPFSLAPQALGEIGVFLGAQALLVGSVGDLGTDYLLQARLVKVAGGQVLWSGNAMFPKAKPGELLPKKVIISRSRADALTRAVVPGLAQFTGGPIGIVKGAVFVAAIGAGTLAAVVGVLGAAAFFGAIVPTLSSTVVFASLFSVSSPLESYRSIGLVDNYMRCGDPILQERAPSEEKTAANSACGSAQTTLGVAGGAFAFALASGLVFAGSAYLLSFVDAAIFGIKSEEVNFEAVE